MVSEFLEMGVLRGGSFALGCVGGGGGLCTSRVPCVVGEVGRGG